MAEEVLRAEKNGDLLSQLVSQSPRSIKINYRLEHIFHVGINNEGWSFPFHSVYSEEEEI